MHFNFNDRVCFNPHYKKLKPPFLDANQVSRGWNVFPFPDLKLTLREAETLSNISLKSNPTTRPKAASRLLLHVRLKEMYYGRFHAMG